MTKSQAASENRWKLPAGWCWARLGEVCDDNIQIRDPRQRPDESFRYIDITSIDNKAKRITDDNKLLGKDAPSRARQVIKTGDIVVSTTRPNLNAVAIVPGHLDGHICSTGFCVLRPNASLENNYLFAFVRSKEFIRALSALVKGALYPAVTDKQVRSQPIPLPPLPEQKRIAGILNEQLTAVDRARAATEEQLGAAKNLSQAYLRAVFNSSEAKKWPSKFLGDICTRISNGTTKTQNNNKFGLPVTRIETISNGRIDINRVGWVELTTNEIEKYKLEDGDILFSHINSVERLGNCSIYNQKEIPALMHGMNLLRIQVSRYLVNPYFLLHFLRTKNAKIFYTEQARRAIGQASLNTNDLSKLQVPIPSLSEQEKIARNLNEQILRVTATIKVVSDQFDAIKQLPNKILQQAFNGEL